MEQIISIKTVSDTTVTAIWTDGKIRLHDFKDYLNRWKEHPKLAVLNNPEIFKTVTIEYGSLAWTDIQMLEDEPGLEDNYFNISPKMLLRDGVIIGEFKPQNRLAQMLKSLRTSANLTQEQLAAKVGMSKTYISKIERGVTDINFGTLEWILEFGLDKTLTISEKSKEIEESIWLTS